ncbi:conjugal transfer protein TraD [Cetobacterium sp.]|uniref:conjugal transfer protein TraD n=1 Tax=Cetobacterium sp. TaxID=2071632 RepID=UPI003EE5DDDA
MKIDNLNKKIKNNREKFEKLQRDEKLEVSSKSKEKRRKRARNLIMLGALFEIEKLDKENGKALLGFLHENKEIFFKNRDKYFEIGESILEKRKNLKTQENNEVGKEEIKELLELVNIFKSKNQDLGVYIQEKFKKKLFQDLTINEVKIVKDYIKNL